MNFPVKLISLKEFQVRINVVGYPSIVLNKVDDYVTFTKFADFAPYTDEIANRVKVGSVRVESSLVKETAKTVTVEDKDSTKDTKIEITKIEVDEDGTPTIEVDEDENNIPTTTETANEDDLTGVLVEIEESSRDLDLADALAAVEAVKKELEELPESATNKVRGLAKAKVTRAENKLEKLMTPTE